ncbi:helix-turn-helix transcriptional regulator [Noviherbaspirillum autotrophicum]|uniref:Transcriptional regulator n=1 Tax=Noviherbaspirillum autotrophicum TaxID=709839 RepID=A0A0C2BQR0_9BURK|nr:HTH domain-containing protein [Noviherbaspirillum autotrophicum]KIF83645.1 transcriptional regulator [Noviherbaspirillum autotrophicum]
MLEILGARQKELLKLLLKNKVGMTADELSEGLNITRNAARQHLAALETDRLVEKGITRPSGGRPEQLYRLTDKGRELFPRHYSWFAELLIESIKASAGEDGLRDRLREMGAQVASQLRNQNPELTTPEEKVQKLSDIMEQLGYNASYHINAGEDPVIEADNCIFHHLAVHNQDVCQFDLELMAAFTGSAVEHQECMARNGNVCRFRLHAKGK